MSYTLVSTWVSGAYLRPLTRHICDFTDFFVVCDFYIAADSLSCWATESGAIYFCVIFPASYNFVKLFLQAVNLNCGATNHTHLLSDLW